jgi:hypothetical protein
VRRALHEERFATTKRGSEYRSAFADDAADCRCSTSRACARDVEHEENDMDEPTRLRGWLLLVLAALSCSQGCGDDGTRADNASKVSAQTGGASAEPSELAQVDALEFVTMTIAGGLCSPHQDCWRKMTVRRESALDLEDSHGTLTYEISAEELALIEQITLTAEFTQRVTDSLAGTDCGGFDIGISMRYQHRGKQVVEVPHVDSCALSAPPGEPRKILNELIVAMDKLKARYLSCPPREEPADFESAFDPLPQRATCCKCNGGVDSAPAAGSPSTVPVGGTLARDAGA